MLYSTITYFFLFRSPLRLDLCVIFNNHVFLFVSLTIELRFMCYIQQSCISFRFTRSPLRWDLCVIFNNHVSFLFRSPLRLDLCVIFNNHVFLFVSFTIELRFMCYIQQSCISFRFTRSPLRWDFCVIFNNHVYISFRFAHH